MKITKMIENVKRSVFPPCPKCPWTLKHVMVDPNPCPMCRLTNYSKYDDLMKMMYRGGHHGFE